MELFFIVLLALIVLGPKDMQKAGKTLGRWMNNLVRSDTWKLIRQASNKIKYLPNELMREAGMDEIRKAGSNIEREIGNEVSRNVEDPFKAWREMNPSTLNIPEVNNDPGNEIKPPKSDNNEPTHGS